MTDPLIPARRRGTEWLERGGHASDLKITDVRLPQLPNGPGPGGALAPKIIAALERLVRQLADGFCCEAGAVASPDPCPWHELDTP